MFKVKALFLLGLLRASGDTWDNLYPATFSQVIQVLNDTVSPVVTFTHPTMGQFTCKPQGLSTTTSYNIRNGQIVDFELITSNEDDNDTSNITTMVEFGLAQSAATIFDNQVGQLSPPPSTPIPSVAGIVNVVLDALDQPTLFVNSLPYVVNNAIFQIGDIELSLDNMDTAATASLQMQLERVKSGIYSLVNNQALPQTPSAATTLASAQLSSANRNANQQQNNGLSSLGVYVVPFDMTLANAGLNVHNSSDQLIKLNPGLSKTPTLPVGTQVVYLQGAVIG